MSVTLHVQPDHRALYDHLNLGDFRAVMAMPFGRVVSRHKDRNTVVLPAGEGSAAQQLYLKRVYRVSFKHILEDLVRARRPRSQPLREWHAIERCRHRGIGVMQGVAWGQRSFLGIPRQAFLLVRAVPAVENLDEALQRLCRPQDDGRAAFDRRRLARELGTFLGRLHRSGLVWPDMVGKHIYLAPVTAVGSCERWAFFLIDVERMTTGATRRSRCRDLRTLARSVRRHRLGPTDLLRFALAYIGEESQGRRERRDRVEREFHWAGHLIRRSWASAHSRPRPVAPDDAVPIHQQRFVRYNRVVVNTAFIPVLQENGLTGFRSVFAYDRGERLDKPNLGPWRQRWRILLNEFGGRQRVLYLKRYDRPPFREQLRRILTCHPRHGTGWWEWRNMRRVAAAGVPTATPVAFGERMRGWFERQSFIVTEAIDGQSLERWVPEHLGPNGDVGWSARRQLVCDLALLVRTLHEARLVHRDLYLSHVYLSHNRDGRPALRLIDLQRVFRPRWRWRRWQVKDLAALNYSTPGPCVPSTERLRFLRAYLGVPRFRPRDRRLIRRILARTKRLSRRDRR